MRTRAPTGWPTNKGPTGYEILERNPTSERARERERERANNAVFQVFSSLFDGRTQTVCSIASSESAFDDYTTVRLFLKYTKAAANNKKGKQLWKIFRRIALGRVSDRRRELRVRLGAITRLISRSRARFTRPWTKKGKTRPASARHKIRRRIEAAHLGRPADRNRKIIGRSNDARVL